MDYVESPRAKMSNEIGQAFMKSIIWGCIGFRDMSPYDQMCVDRTMRRLEDYIHDHYLEEAWSINNILDYGNPTP